MRNVGKNQQDIEHDDLADMDIVPVFPPIAQRAQGERDAEREVVKPHVKQVVVGKNEPHEAEKHISSIYRAQQVAQRQRKQRNGHGEEQFLGNNRGHNVHQRRQRSMRCPVREELEVEPVRLPYLMIVGIMIVLQHLRVVEVRRTILRGKIVEDPYRKHVNHEHRDEEVSPRTVA